MTGLSVLPSWLAASPVLSALQTATWLTITGWTALLASHAVGPHRWQASARTLWTFALLALGCTASWLVAVTMLTDPLTIAYLRRALWHVGLLSLALILVALHATWRLSKRCQNPSETTLVALLGTSAGAGMMMGMAFFEGFRFDPAAWLASPSWSTALHTPWSLGIFALSLAWTAWLATLLPLILAPHSRAKTTSHASSELRLLSAAVGAVLLVTESLWTPTWLSAPHLAESLTAGTTSLSLAGRSSLAAAIVWVSTAWLVGMTLRHAERWSKPMRLAAACASILLGWLVHTSVTSRLGPWSLGRVVYANGTKTEYLQISKYRPHVTHGWHYQAASPSERMSVGRRLFQNQCRFCHAPSGPWSVARKTDQWTSARLDRWLEEQREGDRVGHPWSAVMPPLVGSNDELLALRDFLTHEARHVPGNVVH